MVVECRSGVRSSVKPKPSVVHHQLSEPRTAAAADRASATPAWGGSRNTRYPGQHMVYCFSWTGLWSSKSVCHPPGTRRSGKFTRPSLQPFAQRHPRPARRPSNRSTVFEPEHLKCFYGDSAQTRRFHGRETRRRDACGVVTESCATRTISSPLRPQTTADGDLTSSAERSIALEQPLGPAHAPILSALERFSFSLRSAVSLSSTASPSPSTSLPLPLPVASFAASCRASTSAFMSFTSAGRSEMTVGGRRSIARVRCADGFGRCGSAANGARPEPCRGVRLWQEQGLREQLRARTCTRHDWIRSSNATFSRQPILAKECNVRESRILKS